MLAETHPPGTATPTSGGLRGPPRAEGRTDMWVGLQEWLVREGAVPQMHVGQRLHDVAVRANCWSVHDAADEETGVDPAGAGEASILPHSDVTGAVDWVEPVHGPYEAVAATLRVGDVRLLVQGPATAMLGVDVGARVTLHCSLSIVPDQEWETSRMPDVRRSWTVHGIRQSHWTKRRAHDRTGPPTEVLEETEITGPLPGTGPLGQGARPEMYLLRLAP